ncbi:MAG: FAD-dependent oxidoreductase [Erysipelotrichaceae bacterium]|nr:FAD-dependent oxidoreductase [Erysipelotrichaceae bacterium]
MKKFFMTAMSAFMALSLVGCGGSDTASSAYTPGTYTGTGKSDALGHTVTVEVTVSADKIEKIEVKDEDFDFDQPYESMPQAIIDKNSTEGVDIVAGSTETSDALIAAVNEALAQAKGEGSSEQQGNVAVTFKPGTYTGHGTGYNGGMEVAVTFTDSAIEKIEVANSVETEHVGTPAFDILSEDIKNACGTGVDNVSGATFTSAGFKAAINDAAEQAEVSDLEGFKKNTIEVTAGDPIDETYDVIVVGAGGAGMAAAAQAAQDGNTVLVIEENAEIGGNTLVSGGQYQSVMPYLVWDPENPDATKGTKYDGTEWDKQMAPASTLDELRIIENWSEEPFDEDYYKDHEFVAGDTAELSKHGVHAEYLSTLKALKEEIKPYLAWAEPKVAAGAGEVTLFSTLNLHIFQTYYGGLRPTADMSEWMYGDFDLVSQFITDGQDLKPWLEEQGGKFVENQQTLIGALWYRENEFAGAEIDGTEYPGRWGTYFMAPKNTLLNTSSTASSNKIMLRTKAESLIVDGGKVTGVKGKMYDGTEVTAHANKGVILATGGFAANVDKVIEYNQYWSEEYLTKSTKTTNRSSLKGDGIEMAEAIGADTTGMNFTQLMPISWVDNGNLAFGAGNYAVWINPNTGKRFVDETSERDVLSLAEFRNGMEVNGTKGVFVEIYNKEQPLPAPMQLGDEDYEGRYYTTTIDKLGELFEKLGVKADPATVRTTIEEYDKAVMANTDAADYPDVKKTAASRTIGNCEKDENGKYLADTYDLDGTQLRVRLMAPSTHHTMGGVKVDTERHVLDANGEIIEGLYAAGEVTGGIHGGNRLGGNAIVEIFVSGRTAAKAVTADNK